MSSLFKSSQSKDTTTNQTSAPLDWQASAVQTAFGRADDAYKQASGATAPNNFVAQFSPEQLAVFQKMMGAGGDNTGAALSSAGLNSATGGFDALNGFTPKGGTQYNIDAATQYANNPAIDGVIDAAMRDSRRQVSEEALPAVARNAALGGNVNSNKTAISEGILQRGLAEKGADVSSTVRNAAYQDGLKLAQTEANSSNDSTLQAMLARISGGVSAVDQGVNATSGLFDVAGKGVAGTLAGSQAGLDEQAAKYDFQTQSPFDALNNYYKIIGSNNWGTQTNGTSNVTTTNSPSTMDSIGKVMSTAGTLGSWFTSDERVKENIHVVGELFDGLSIYRYNYKGDPAHCVYVGLMAQDVEKVYPEAVQTINGVKHVNYDLATRNSAT